MNEGLVERVSRAIAADQGEAYAEHRSEYDQYARIAVSELGVSELLEALSSIAVGKMSASDAAYVARTTLAKAGVA